MSADNLLQITGKQWRQFFLSLMTQKYASDPRYANNGFFVSFYTIILSKYVCRSNDSLSLNICSNQIKRTPSKQGLGYTLSNRGKNVMKEK